GGRQLGIDTSRTSEHILSPDKKDWNPVQRRIVVDEIQTLLVLHVPGQAAADKKRKAELIRKHFNASWTEIEEEMPLLHLRAGYDSLHRELEGVWSRYHQAPAPAINDELPGDLGPPKAVIDHTERDGVPGFLDRRKANGEAEPSYIDLVGGG